MTAAPEHHDLLFENEHVRVLDTDVAPGDTVPVQTHCWPGVLYVLGVSDFVSRDPEGEVLLDTRGTAQAAAGCRLGKCPRASCARERRGTELRNVTVELEHIAGS